MIINVMFRHALSLWLTNADRQRLEAFEICIWRKMKVSWKDKISNKEVVAQVNETRTMLNTVWSRKHHCYVLQHEELLCNLIEGRLVENLREAGEGYKC